MLSTPRISLIGTTQFEAAIKIKLKMFNFEQTKSNSIYSQREKHHIIKHFWKIC